MTKGKKQETGLVGASVVAKALGIHPDTVRKRAKAGKIPYTKVGGQMRFDLVAITGATAQKAPVLPRILAKGEQVPVGSKVRIVQSGHFSGTEAIVVNNDEKYGVIVDASSAVPNLGLGANWGCAFQVTGCLELVSLPAVTGTKNVTDVVFVLDRSSSMHGVYGSAKENLDKYFAQLLASADENNRYYASIVNFDDEIIVKLRGEDVHSVKSASSYYLNPKGMTRLNDAVYEAIKICCDRDDGKRAFLIYVLTDGGENSSVLLGDRLADEIRACTQTDRYTFAVAGPYGITNWAGNVGIPGGNVTIWETTLAGSQNLGLATISAMQNYTASRSVGAMKSTSFYASVAQPAEKFAQQLDDKLDDISSQVDVKRVVDGDPREIKKFCLQKWGNFEKGRYFYQLIESEKVQDYKGVIIQDTATGNFYQGWRAAKKLLGLPDFSGTVRIKPGKLGEFKVFIQSTSVNRKLDPGTTVLKL